MRYRNYAGTLCAVALSFWIGTRSEDDEKSGGFSLVDTSIEIGSGPDSIIFVDDRERLSFTWSTLEELKAFATQEAYLGKYFSDQLGSDLTSIDIDSGWSSGPYSEPSFIGRIEGFKVLIDRPYYLFLPADREVSSRSMEMVYFFPSLHNREVGALIITW